MKGASTGTTLLTILMIIIIGVAGAFIYIKNGQVNDAENKLAAAQVELTGVQADLASTQALLETKEFQLSQTENDLASNQLELDNANSELTDANNDLANINGQLNAALDKISYASDQIDSLKVALEEKTTLATSLQSNLDNLQANYDLLAGGYGYVYNDPTYQQVKDFIATDTTDSNTYVYDTYVCEDFSFDVRNHAMQQKIRCAYVSIRFSETAHAIVAFNTTDRGIVYFEPQTDEEVNLRAGYHYWSQCVIVTTGGYYPNPTTYDDVIVRFNLFW